MRVLLLLALLAILKTGAAGQAPDSLPARALDFTAREGAEGLRFSPALPPLLQRAGAPLAFWEYYWEFGDGAFGLAENPVHEYAAPGDYEVIFAATGNYDTGKTPDKKAKKVTSTKKKDAYASTDPAMFPHVIEDLSAHSIGIRAVRSPSPSEEFILILSYHNVRPEIQSGRLHLFFNERRFSNAHFRYLEGRTYFGEQEEESDDAVGFLPVSLPAAPDFLAGEAPAFSWRLPSAWPAGREQLDEAKANFRDHRQWRFGTLTQGETRNFFVSLGATPEMLADTNVTIHLEFFLETDDGAVFERAELPIEIVASHDPNVMAVSDRKTGFRGIRKNALRYRTRFQNTGQGPAQVIKITTDIPEGLDVERLRIMDNYPACPLCPDEKVDWSCLDTIIREGELVFTFRNVYLPGTRQQNVRDRDSTRGFVDYELFPGKKIRKRPFRSRAGIEFDREPPVYTNWARTRFRYEPSPGLQAGYRFFPDSSGMSYYLLGLSLSDYKAFRLYLQPELRTGIGLKQETVLVRPRDTLLSEERRGDLVIRTYTLSRGQGLQTVSRNTVELVPLQLRKNVGALLGLGLGMAWTLTFEHVERRMTIETAAFQQQCVPTANGTLVCRPERPQQVGETQTSEETSNIRRVSGAPHFFADINLGLVRAGPALGGRAHFYPGRRPQSGFELYATWKL